MDPVFAIALAGGGVVAVKVLGQDGKVTPAPAKKVSGAAATLALIRSKQAAVPSGAAVKAPPVAARASSYLNYAKGASQPSEVEQMVTKKAREAYDQLSADAKKAACAALKAQYPNDPAIQKIPCGASYDAIMKGIAAAGGTAACAATGAGAAVSPLCGIAAAWIAGWAGPKFKEWGNDAYDGVKSGLESTGSAIKDGASAVVSWAGGLF